LELVINRLNTRRYGVRPTWASHHLRADHYC
jgi:hypothetical protein